MSRSREELVNEIQLNLWRTIEPWVPSSNELGIKVEELAEAIIDEFELSGCDPAKMPEEESIEEYYADMDQFEGKFNG